MLDTIEMQTYPEILIVYSNNVLCYENPDMFNQIRTLVLVCCRGTGYLVIAKKAPGKGYVSLKRWVLKTDASVSFHLPMNKTHKLDVRLLPEMVGRYKARPKDWSAISTTTRFSEIMPIPRDSTST